MNNMEFKMSNKDIANASGQVLEYLENSNFKLTEMIVILDSALGIARAKMNNSMAFASTAQLMKEIISGNIK